MNTKMRTVFSLVIALFVMSTLTTTTSDAQDFSRWGLPDGAEARLGKGIIESIAYSPDGRRLAVGASTGIWIYDAATGEELSLLGGHTGSITSIAYSRDGKTLASTSGGNLALWNVATGTLIKTLSYESKGDTVPVHNIAFSPDGTRIAVGSNTTSSGGFLWNVATGTLINTLDRNRGIASVKFSPDGKTIASGHESIRTPTLAFWDGTTGEFIKAFHPTDRGIRNVEYSPDGTILACATSEGRVILWDVAASLPIDTFVAFEGNTLTVIAYSPDGKTIAAGAVRIVSIWNEATGRRNHSLSGHIEKIRSITYSPDSRTVASGSEDGTVRFWNASTGALRYTITGHTNEINTVAYSPDGNTLAIGGDYSVNTISLWDVATRTLRNSLEIDTAFDVDSLAYSPNGNTIAGGSVKGGYLWDAATHKIRHRPEWRAGTGGIVYSPDGSTIASSYGRIALSSDGTKLVTQGPGTPGSTQAWLSDATTGAIIKSFSPDARFGTDTIAIWDVATRRLIDKLTVAHEDSRVHNFRGIAYSPDGNTIAAAVDTSVYLWDATTSRLRYRLTEDTHKGHHAETASVAFSPDSMTLASSGFTDRTVRLWDVRTGTLKSVLRGHSNAVVSLMFSPDGTTLASGSHDGTALLWRLAPASPEPDRIAADINNDGKINIQDLVLIASKFGQTGKIAADVNGDEVVNIADLVLVAGALGNAGAAPMVWGRYQELAPTREEVQEWLTQAQQLNLTDATSQRGIHFLEQLLLAITPEETALLANYPNPFNPETWIPYQLAKSVDVVLHIYTIDGGLVRTLSLGHQTVGRYQSRSRAAYWDGKNALGEPVASGVYFYTLTAGDFTATRKMLIRK